LIRASDRAASNRTSRTTARRALACAVLVASLACRADQRATPASGATAADAGAGVDSLNARLSKAYRDHDPVAYGALFTDSAVFEWPAFETVRGRAGLAAMAKSNWASLSDMDLRLHVADRRIAPDHVTEFGAFQQIYRDTSGNHVEYGRYVAVLVPGSDGWRMDRFFGFSDSTAKR
jgi:ketosteroid isomerase-like protein